MQAAIAVVINRRALRRNLQRLRELASSNGCGGGLDAYSHGLLEDRADFPMLTPLA